MFKSKVYILILMIVTGVSLVSCEKVIDVDLKDASPAIVIEGVITNDADSQYVNIHRSVPFGESNVFPRVTGAKVTITDNTGRVFTLKELRRGFYMSRNFIGRSGNTYNLKVEAEGKMYTATSTMPEQVNMDSLRLVVNTFLGDTRKNILVKYNDPPGTKNHYRFILTVNERSSGNIFTFDDNFNNGKAVTRELIDFDLDPQSGDIAEIEMQCIDENIYRYWQGLDQNQSRGGASVTPANPVSNISNGALGYFSAHTQQIRTISIP